MPQTQGYLIIEKKNGTDGKPHPVDRTLKLGRGQACDVRVHVQSVSDEHCIIIIEPGRPVRYEFGISKSYFSLNLSQFVVLFVRSFNQLKVGFTVLK